MLKLADTLSLPLSVVTEKLAWLGTTGSGKSYGATKLAELMLEVGAQIVALDPVGIWYGLRIGFKSPLYIFGGLHGDVPLESNSGAMIADLIVDRGISAVLDVSQFETEAEMHRFAIGFGRRFFFRKKAQRSAVHLFVEECQELFPQNPMGSENNVLHEYNRIWKIGRNFGIGGSLISQRPQEVNKKALNLARTVFAFQTTGPQERKTIQGWMKDKGIDEDIEALLPKLQIGHPKVWSPGFLDVSKTVRILNKQSADVSKTPKVGDRTAEKPLTKVDLEQLKAQMASTIEKAKADDPIALRAEIVTLRKQIAALGARKPVKAPKIVKVSVLKENHVKALEGSVKRILSEMERHGRALRDGWASQTATIQSIIDAMKSFPTSESQVVDAEWREPAERMFPKTMATIRKGLKESSNGAATDTDLSPGARKVLTAIAQYGTASKETIAVLTGYKETSRYEFLRQLVAKQYVLAGNGEWTVTDAGMDALGSSFQPLPTGKGLRAYWLNALSGGEQKVFSLIVDQYPGSVDRDTLKAETGYKDTSIYEFVRLLAARKLVVNSRNEVKASPNLFQ